LSAKELDFAFVEVFKVLYLDRPLRLRLAQIKLIPLYKGRCEAFIAYGTQESPFPYMALD